MVTQHDAGPEGTKAGAWIAANEELLGVFERLAQAVAGGEFEAAAGLWALPALILGEKEARSIASAAELEEFFLLARERYHARGIVASRPELQQVKWITPRIARVTVRWPHLDALGREVGSEAVTYTLRRDEHGTLKLQVAVRHGSS